MYRNEVSVIPLLVTGFRSPTILRSSTRVSVRNAILLIHTLQPVHCVRSAEQNEKRGDVQRFTLRFSFCFTSLLHTPSRATEYALHAVRNANAGTQPLFRSVQDSHGIGIACCRVHHPFATTRERPSPMTSTSDISNPGRVIHETACAAQVSVSSTSLRPSMLPRTTPGPSIRCAPT